MQSAAKLKKFVIQQKTSGMRHWAQFHDNKDVVHLAEPWDPDHCTMGDQIVDKADHVKYLDYLYKTIKHSY